MSLYDGSMDNKSLQYYGITVGVVTNNKDPEKLARVKVKLPDRLGDIETDWARMAVLMSGKEMGTFILPEVGDEVLVAFREGRIEEPYIIGCLWNEKQKPPETNEDGKNNIRKIKSRSGHEITIDDTADAGFIQIKVKNGAMVKVDNKDESTITIKDKAGKNKAVFDGNSGNVTVLGDQKIELTSGSSKVTIDSMKSSIELKSDLKISLTAAQIEVKASGTLDLSSDGMVTIKGSMVKIN